MALSRQVRWSFPSYPGFKVFQYASGTTTKQATYTTSALSVANANPLSADANGLLGAMYEDPSLSYKYVMAPSTDSDPPTNAIFTQDNATGAAAEAGILAVLSKPADYTVVATDGDDLILLVDASLAAVTITLYTAVGNTGRKIRVVKTDSSAFTVTIDPSGTQTWNGATTKVLGDQYEATNGVSNGSNWISFGDSLVEENAQPILEGQVFS